MRRNQLFSQFLNRYVLHQLVVLFVPNNTIREAEKKYWRDCFQHLTPLRRVKVVNAGTLNRDDMTCSSWSGKCVTYALLC